MIRSRILLLTATRVTLQAPNPTHSLLGPHRKRAAPAHSNAFDRACDQIRLNGGVEGSREDQEVSKPDIATPV